MATDTHSRRTKIVATLGPATDAPGMLEKIIAEGVNVVRLNLSHGQADDHRARAMVVGLSVGEIEAYHVDAFGNDFFQHAGRVGGRAQGSDDLGAAGVSVSSHCGEF